MNSSEAKALTIAVLAVGTVCIIPIITSQMDKKRRDQLEDANKQRQAEKEIKIAEIQSTYPPEYWVAEKAKTDAKAAEVQARIESEERLEMDKRDRETSEAAALREFEKDAPESYWVQKKLEAEERTKQVKIQEEQKTQQELNRQRFESEKAVAKAHSDALKEGARIAERAIRRDFGSYSGYTLL